MRTDGFHYTSSPKQAGYGVSPDKIERGQVVSSGGKQVSWQYHEDIPLEGRRDLFFFSYADLCHLMQKPQSEVKSLYLANGWRWRFNSTTKVREFYLADLLVTSWTYMLSWYGAQFDDFLLEDARSWLMVGLSMMACGNVCTATGGIS